MAKKESDQEKIYRVFRLIHLLSQTPRRNVKQLAGKLEVSVKTVYRYLELLEKLNYQIDKDEKSRYFLLIDYQNDKELIDFDEAGYLQDLLWQAAADSPYRDRLLHKLNQQYSLAPLVQSLAKFQDYDHVRRLSQAIESGLRVRLHNYCNAQGEIGTRYLEPIELQNNHCHLWAYDLDGGEEKQFRISRIGMVETLSERISGQYNSRATDIFGLPGASWLPLRLRLSNRAYQLLLEEHSDARPYVRTQKGHIYFDGPVRNYLGIGRFVLGLPGEVEVLETEEFRAYLRERAAKAGW